jgi:hypothetical protein
MGAANCSVHAPGESAFHVNSARVRTAKTLPIAELRPHKNMALLRALSLIAFYGPRSESL